MDKSNCISLFGAYLEIDPRHVLVHRTVDIEYTPHEIRVYFKGSFIQRSTKVTNI